MVSLIVLWLGPAQMSDSESRVLHVRRTEPSFQKGMLRISFKIFPDGYLTVSNAKHAHVVNGAVPNVLTRDRVDERTWAIRTFEILSQV